jgi:hypothetical protein
MGHIVQNVTKVGIFTVEVAKVKSVVEILYQEQMDAIIAMNVGEKDLVLVRNAIVL